MLPLIIVPFSFPRVRLFASLSSRIFSSEISLAIRTLRLDGRQPVRATFARVLLSPDEYEIWHDDKK